MSSPARGRRVAVAILRQDLRIHDNAVLLAAHQAGTHLLPIYVYDERHIELSGLPSFVRRGPEARTRICKFWRTSVFRARFLTEGVYDLQDRLRQRGSDLLVRFGRLEEVVGEVVDCLNAGGDHVQGVWLQKDFCAEELAIENKLAKTLNKNGIKLHQPDVQTLSTSRPSQSCPHFASATLELIGLVDPPVDVQDLPFSVDQTPDVFTPFRKKVEALGRLGRLPLTMPDLLNPFPPPPPPLKAYPAYGAQFDHSGPAEVLPGLLAPLKHSYSSKYADPSVARDPRSAFPLAGGETAALDRLDWYIRQGSPPPAHNYKETRNGLVGHAYSTKLSPFLCLGMVSPREIISALEEHEAKFGATQSTYWVRFEILWRDYFLFISRKYGTRLFKLDGFEGKTDPKQAKIKTQPGWWKGYNEDGSIDDHTIAWFEGKTGVPFIDANQAELRDSGFMSNRGRQNVASFLTKDLQVDWRIGAEFFEAHLIDYETGKL